MAKEAGLTDKAASGAETVREAGWRFAFGVAIFGQLVNWLPTVGFTPLLPEMQREWGMSFTQLGFFTGLIGVVGAAVSLLFGLFIKRYGAKRAVLLSLGSTALGLAVVALANDFVAGSLGRALWAGGYRAGQVALFTAMALLAPQRVMASMMGLSFAVANVAAMIGAPISGYFGTSFGWRTAMAVFAAVVVAAFLAFLTLFRPPRAVAPAQQAAGAPAATTSAYRNRTVWLLGLLFALNALTAQTTVYFVPSAMVEIYKLSTSDVANTITLGFALGVPMVVLAGVLTDRLGTYKWVVVAFNVPVILAALLLSVPDPAVFAVATVALLALGMAPLGPIHALPTKLLPPGELGAVYAILTAGAGVSSYFGPRAVGLLRDISGNFNAGWYLMAAVGTAGLIQMICMKVK